MTFWCGSGSGSFYFRHWPSRCLILLQNLFCLLLLKVHLHHFSKIKSHKEVAKTVGIKVFLTNFASWLKDPDPDPYLWLMYPEPEPWDPKKYGSRFGSGSSTLGLGLQAQWKEPLPLQFSIKALIILIFLLHRNQTQYHSSKLEQYLLRGLDKYNIKKYFYFWESVRYRYFNSFIPSSYK